MKILSIDTASKICGVSIVENQKIICNIDINTGHTHSENLMPTISKAFEDLKMSINDIDLLVCDIGPGSFTGIRIGVATVKAFSDSMNIPCVGISSLEALAYKAKLLNLKNVKTICSIIDCKNDNCYFAVYELINDKISCKIEPVSSQVTKMLQTIKSFDNILFIGDGAEVYKNVIKANIPNSSFTEKNDLDSYSLAIAGAEYYNQFGENNVLPLYLKKPQAERQLEEKLAKKEN